MLDLQLQTAKKNQGGGGATLLWPSVLTPREEDEELNLFFVLREGGPTLQI